MVVYWDLVGFYNWINPTDPTYSWGYKSPSGVKQQKSRQLRPQEMQQLTLRLNSLELRVAGADQAGAEFMRNREENQ